MARQRHPKIEHWDDERPEGNSLIVTLKPGWRFAFDHMVANHVAGFETVKEAMSAVRQAVACSCSDRCSRRLAGGDG